MPQDFDLQLADALGDERLPPPPCFAAQCGAARSVAGRCRTRRVVRSQPQSDIAVPDRTAVHEAAATVRLREAVAAVDRGAAEAVGDAELDVRPDRAIRRTCCRRSTAATGPWGRSLNLPVLTGGRQRGDEQVARAELEQARLQLRADPGTGGARLDGRPGPSCLRRGRPGKRAPGTIQQATRAYEIAERPLSAPACRRSSSCPTRGCSCSAADANRALAARDLQVARARVALLPDLPIGASVTPGLQQCSRRCRLRPAPQPQISGPVITAAAAQTGGFQVGR